MKILNTYLNKSWFVLLYGLMLFPLLPRGLESVLMISFTFVSLVLWVLSGKKISFFRSSKRDKIIFLAYSSFPLFSVLSLLYTNNLEEGFNAVIKVLPLFFFPLIFGFFQREFLSKKLFARLSTIYLFAIFFGLVILHGTHFTDFFFIDKTHWQIRQLIESATDVHGTYMSIWIGFGILILFYRISSNRICFANLKENIFYMVLICYFIYWQITIGARMPLAISMLLLAGYFIISFRKNKAIIVGAIIVVFSIVFSFQSDIVDRVKNVINEEHSFPEGNYAVNYESISPEDIRKGIYFCSWVLVKNAPFFGHGVGDVRNVMDSCYSEEFDSNVYQMFHYNTHNQYFHVLLSAGIFALLLFILSLLMPIYLAYKQKNYLWFSFTFLIMICFFTENIISRHDGVIFYSLFNSILTYTNLKSK